ncbi:Rib/alpha-like domain-containing protein [Streptococcus sp. 4886]|uniref:Rib/alpha-like domain-containing protein n=1 Tax=Streptococcus sp. 4886 TaxID=2582682 RepID=UPI0015636D44|nr:Rib/alpha-like domain-containing protein [Streptococcus sp. 4886]
MFKNKGVHARSQVEKFTRYSIRKVSFGVASVAVATGLFFLGGGSVQANSPVVPARPEVGAEGGVQGDSESLSLSKVNDNTLASESSTDSEMEPAASVPEVPATVEPQPETAIEASEVTKVDTSKLGVAIARMQSALEKAGVSEKTAATIENAKEELAKAQTFLSNEKATQEEVDKATRELKNKAFVIESMPKAEKKEANNNQDSRNGQAIPGKGESGFREATGAQETPLADVARVSDDELTKAKQELQGEITKLTAKISTEEAKGEGEIDKEFVELLNTIKTKSETIYNVEIASLTTEKEKHAALQKLKAQKDTLRYYQSGKVDWGAPINNNAVRFGNNNETGVFANLKEGFGEQNFSSAISKQKDSGDQQLGPDTNSPNVGSATYHWKELELTREQAADGTKLNGWKLTNNTEKVTLVKGESPTNITPKPNQTYTPKSAKLYSNNDKVTATGGQNRPNAGGGMLSGLISAEDMKKVGLGRVDRDYYLELGKKGNGIYRDVDVNPNSLLFVNVLHNGAYGPLALPSEGENVKLTIVDAYTGQKLTELKRKNGKSTNEFEQNPGSVGNGWRNLLRAVHIPEGTTKVRVIVEAGSPGQTNKTLGNNPIEDGYIIGGIGIATGPAVNISTNITSEKKSGKYGFTDDAIYGKKQTGTIDLNIRNLGGASITGFQTKYKVTIKVPKGVVLGSLGTPSGRLDLNTANGQSAWELNNTWTSDFRFDKIKSELSFLVDSSKRGIIAGDNRKSDFIVKIPFETTADYVGSSTFEVSGQNGFPGDDSLGNVLHRYGNNDSNFYDVSENVNAPSLKYSNEPNYKYKKTLYIDSFTDVDKITVPVGTSLDKIKELSKSKAKETIESEEYKRKLDETNATATLDDQGMSTGVVATDVAKENAGVIKVPVVHSRDGKNYKNTVDIEVNVVKSTTNKLVVFEGDKITDDQVKSSVTSATINTKTGVVNNPNEADVINTTGKAGEAGLKIPTTITHEINGTNINETVEVPVTVLPKATGEVEVHKGASVDKVKEVAKTKATEVATSADFKAKLPEGFKDVVVGEITEKVLATMTAEKGTKRGTVKVPVTYTVDGVEYTKDAEITVNVKGSETKSVYVVEGQKPDPAKVKEAVTPGKGGTVQDPTDANLPDTTGKVGATDVVVPTTVKYSTGDETVNVPVTVLPKPEPKGITVLNGTSNENLIDAIRANVNKAITGLTNVPDGVTPFITDDAIVTPKTDQNGQQTPVSVTVKYRDKATGKVIDDISVDVDVPVNVVGSTPTSKVVFEGDEITAKDITDAVTPGEKGTKGEPTDLAKDITANPGVKEVTVPVTYTDQNGATLTEPVKVKVTVLPKPTPQGIIVAKDSDKEKAKEKALTKAKEAIADGTFKGKLPANVTNVSIDENVENPDLSDDTDVTVTVKYTVDREEKTTVVKVPVTVVEGVPQIVPVDENNKQPNPENSIDKTEYPDDSTFEYDPKTPVNTTMPGDYTVNVIVKDKEGNPIAEVPATVRVVESYPQFVPVDKDKKQPAVEGSIDPKAFPKDTEFTYETPVDTTRPGEKDVVVVAKIGDEVIAKVPAKVMVVEPKTQYVVADPSKPQPDASKSIDPEQYPDGITFEYKTPVDTTTPGEKDVVVVAKDGDDTLVEVPTKVKVVQDYPQIVPVNEGKKQPSPEDSIDTDDYPKDATFEYKEEVDTTTPGDKKVTVVVKQGDKVLVEVPSTVRVVESYPKYVPVDPAKKQPDPKENINPNDFPTGTTFEYKDNTPVDTTTPGEKPVTVVAKLNGQPITEIPATIVVVESKTQYVPINAENDKKPKPQDSITPDDYPEESTFEYKTPEGQTTPYDGTTPGEKDVTVVVKDSDGDTIVEVPAKIKVVQGKEQLIPVNAEDKDKPKAEDSITPSDYPEGSTFEYKVPEGQTTPYDGTTPGDKPVTVVVKDKNGNVLVEVPATIKVVEDKPKPIETPVTNTPLTKDDISKYVKVPAEGKVTNVENIPDLTTPGKKDPVKVTVELPNGKVITVEVPVNVTPVKEIETPVTKTPLTPEDYTKRITIPEGGKVTKVENIPDLTTPGKKDPVKVTVELPNGKVITVEVPVNVTPITPIETPVTKDKLTPEDVLKQIKVPDGATVKVGDLPDLTTPGKKDPVKVTITLPNDKIVTVEVPVNVTPIEDIVKKQGDPITAEDVEKHIPKGVKVISIGDKPTTDVPGERPSIPVVVELPNGIRVTMNIPVIVTPKVTPVVVSVGTPVTSEDVKKHIELPKGWTVTKVGEIPTTTTPGTKPVVSVEIELPDGRKITVDVPVIVTPTVRQIVVPQGTPITPDDVKGHIDLPKEPGWEIVEVGEIPTTIPAGVKPSVKVKIKVPTGEIIEVDVPVIVTPKVTPIVVEVGTPITEEDVKKKVDLPEGWEIVEVGEIPTTETPGVKPVVKVKVKLPDGRIITVDVPVTVTPKSQNGGGVIAQNGDSTVQIVTEYLDENGNRITSDKEGKHNPIELEGYEYSHSTTDAKGNTLHHYKKVTNPIDQEQPVAPVQPEQPTTPSQPAVPTPAEPSVATDSATQPATPKYVDGQKELPNTGTEANASLAALGLLGALGGFGLLARKKKED